MKPYPKVYSEDVTLQHACDGWSISRFGDGELRLAAETGKHIAQKPDARLAAELRSILAAPAARELVCIPNSEAPNGKPVMWGPTRYSAPVYRSLYWLDTYGSSFITRPDSAPWIDNDSFWLRTRSLWEGKSVTLVIGTRGGSLTYLKHAKAVRLIYGPERDAYEACDRLMDEIGTPGEPVLICLGPAATILAHRLALKGEQGLDLGHVGRFMPQVFLQ